MDNFLERAVILGGNKIKFFVPGLSGTETDTENRPLTMREMEKAHIRNAIALTNGKIGGREGASALLGLKRTTLINRMKKLGITVEKSV